VSVNSSTATTPGQPAFTANLRPRPGEQQPQSGPALYQPDSESRTIGYTFVAMPPIAFELCRQGKLPWSALGVLESLIGFQKHVPGSCWTTTGTLAGIMESNGRSLETNERAVRRSLSEIFAVGLVGRRAVPIPDPQEPANRTGYRYDFLWPNDVMSSRIPEEERLANGGEDIFVPQRLGDIHVRDGGQLCPKVRTKMSPKVRLNKQDSSKSSSNSRETSKPKSDDDDSLNSLGENAPTPRGDSELIGRGPIPELQTSAVPAPVDRHAANGPPAVPAARGGVSAAEAAQDTDLHFGTPVSSPKGLPANSQDPAPVPAAADPSVPIPGDIIDKLRAELGDTIANKVANNPGKVRDASNTDRYVLFAAARKMKPYLKKAHNPFEYFLTIVKEFAKDGIPDEFAKSPQKPAVVYFKAAPRPENNDDLKREGAKRIREIVELAMKARQDATAAQKSANRQAGEDWFRKQRQPFENWPKAVLADPIIASDPVVANVVGRGDVLDQRTGSPQDAELAEAV
jgi:hypothetical protein